MKTNIKPLSSKPKIKNFEEDFNPALQEFITKAIEPHISGINTTSNKIV